MKKQFSLIIFFVFSIFITNDYAQNKPRLRVEILISSKIKKEFHPGGHLTIHITKQHEREPRFRSEITLGINPVNWNGNKPFVMSTTSKSLVAYGLSRLKIDLNHIYYYQVLYKQNREDGLDNAPGNLYSDTGEISLTHDTTLIIKLNRVVQPIAFPPNKFVKKVVIKSTLLSHYWHFPTFLHASVLLPSGYFNYPDKIYPICYRAPGLNGRYDWVTRLQGRDHFAKWWFSGSAPQIIYVFLDARGPYGDTYEVNSRNNGPCGDALIKELIPAVEKKVHYKGGNKLRFIVGYSTGGWVSLALQIFYPKEFNGVWTYSPDPVDFDHFGLINIYHDKSVFYNKYGILLPSERTVYGNPTRTMKDQIQMENADSRTGNYLISGGQFGAYNAAWGPRGKDGLPALLFDPVTGKINHSVAEQWKPYDLKRVLQKKWKTLGPLLQGKIWIWTGDMDKYYSNLAVWSLNKFFKSTKNPKSNAKVTFTPMAGHGQAWSDKNVLKMVAAKVAKIK